MNWLVVALFGALVGSAELINRYRDAPVRSLWNPAAVAYILLNIAASAGALALVQTFDWKFGGGSEEAVRWNRVLVAGFGAMALFRTSLFIVRAGDRDIGVGPASFLQIFLAAADRGVDRGRERNRAARIGKLMEGVDYAKAMRALPLFCLALMQNLPDEEQQALNEALALLGAASLDDDIKLRLLGLELINVVGEQVLEDAVSSLGAEIRKAG